MHLPFYWAVKKSSQIYLTVFTVFTVVYLLFLALQVASISTTQYYPGAAVNLQSLMDFVSSGVLAGAIICAITIFLQIMQFLFFAILVFKVQSRLKWELR